MKNRPLVSIITPSYNTSEYIVETIESVLSQSYENWEMLIVDDCSTDNSVEMVKKYVEQDSRVKLLINSENTGVALTRNRAIEESTGEYIALLDSDDTWLPNKLEKQIELMLRENIMMSFSSYDIMNKNGDNTGSFLINEKVTYSDMLKTSSIGTLTTIYNAKELGKYYFEEIGHEDYVWKLAILKNIEYAEGLIESLAKYRVASKSLSSNKLKVALWQWKIYREVEKLSFLKSIYYFLNYAFYGFFKYR